MPTSDTTTIASAARSSWAGELLHAEGDVTLGAFGLTLSAHVSFESTTRTNLSRVIKIVVTNLSFDVGDPSIFHIGGAHGNIFVSDEGVAAEFDVPVAFSFGNSTAGVSFNATVGLAINTIGARHRRDLQRQAAAPSI